MASGLIEIMKQASLEAMENGKPTDIRYGTVKSVSPLSVQITSTFTLPSSVLVVPQRLTDYQVECTVTQEAESTSGVTSKSATLTSEEDPIKSHTHTFTVSSGGGTSTMKITVHNALKVGDRVALLRQQGGQSYLILDRV